MSHFTISGNLYFNLLSLMIIGFASYTMFSMSSHLSSKPLFPVINWLTGGAAVFVLGLWAMHVVSLLGSNFLVVLDFSVFYALFGCSVFTYAGIYMQRSRLPKSAKLAFGSFFVTIGAALLHYISMLAGGVSAVSIHWGIGIAGILITFFGCLFSFFLIMRKKGHYRFWASCVLATALMSTHLLAMNALVVEQDHVLTTDLLNHYMMLLGFILGIAMLLICSFAFTTWRTSRKYKMMNTQYKLLVENSMDTIAIISDKRWHYMNAAGLKMFEAERKEDLIGKSIFDVLDEKHHWVAELWQRDRQDEEETGSVPIELEWRTVKGGRLYTELVWTSVHLEGRYEDQVIIRDISERKKNEELLINSEKLYIAGQLAAGIAHEIRNPLTSLKGFLQLISSGRTENKNYFGIMKTELVRIESIVSELLMLSKPQIYDFIPLDIRKVLKDTSILLETEATLHDIEMKLQLGNAPLWVKGVENQMKQVFINVIKNAIEAMSSGGSIEVRATLENDGQVAVYIKDEGPGMEKEQLSKIGQPFYTTKEEGTGLGLMVTYKIVDNHQGTITADSEKGEGTVFRIRFPFYDPNRLSAANET
ncbi:ATP-binding protein [Paenibacillus sp. NPDC058071]|uniref:ATP-binding protein n=1 Tax=Paenibacillus sp. NPDC058071 TaxID=3346326 RepID=UPI0036D9DE81